MKKDINKQEEMVAALWDFAHDLQTNKPDVWGVNRDGSEKTAMNHKAIMTAMERLAKNFNLELQEVQ